VRDPALVLPAVAKALEVRELPGEELADTLAAHLKQKQLLVLLDNFEQVVNAATEVAWLLDRCQDLRIMVTSRERLRLRVEYVYPVPPLLLADPAVEPDALLVNEAVMLFASRAAATAGGFVLDTSNAPTVAEICARLDGLPLAIELAAARISTLPPQALLARLEQRLSLLTRGARDADERQQTLHATIDWSYQLLSETERRLFEQVSVFVDGCSLEAAQAVCEQVVDSQHQLLDVVSALLDKSLLQQRLDSDRQPRYWMLETVREYALARLVDRGQSDVTAERHSAHFLALAEQTELLARTGDQGALFAALDTDEANLRAAFEHTTAEKRLRFATALWGYWAARGSISDWLPRMEEAVAAAAQPPASALVGLATLRHLAGFDNDRLLPEVERAADVAEQAEDDFAAAQALLLTGRLLASGLGRQTAGEHAWERALSYAERGGYRTLRAEIIGWLMVQSIFGPLPTSRGIDRCTAFLENSGGDESIEAFAQVELSVLQAMRGEFTAARKLLAVGNAIFRRLGLNVWAANNGQEGFYVEMLAGDPAAAVSLLTASYRELDEMGERGFLSTIAGMLAHALHATGDDEEAERFSLRSEQAAAKDDVTSQVLWRTARAKICARKGDLATAQRLAREAITLAPAAEMPNLTADAYSDLAEISETTGRDEEATAALQDALLLYEQKENLVSLARTQQRLQRLSRPAV
jgi:predicted ATPase